MLSNSNFDWLKMFIRKIEKLKIFFEKLMTSSYYDVIVFWQFYSFSAWILSSNFNGILKTGNYVKANPLSFQKIKTELNKQRAERTYLMDKVMNRLNVENNRTVSKIKQILWLTGKIFRESDIEIPHIRGTIKIFDEIILNKESPTNRIFGIFVWKISLFRN